MSYTTLEMSWVNRLEMSPLASVVESAIMHSHLCRYAFYGS